MNSRELAVTVTSGFSEQIHLKVCLGGTAFVRCRREKPLEPWDCQLLQEGSRQEKVTWGPEVSMWMWDDLLPSLTKGSDGISGGSVMWQSEIRTILVAPSRQLFWPPGLDPLWWSRPGTVRLMECSQHTLPSCSGQMTDTQTENSDHGNIAKYIPGGGGGTTMLWLERLVWKGFCPCI